MTYLLKNPAKVRKMVKEGIDLLVKFEGEIVMRITVPKAENSQIMPPTITSGVSDFVFSREDLYSGKYDS